VVTLHGDDDDDGGDGDDGDDGGDGDTVVEAELTVDGEHTGLVVEERGFPLAVVADHGAGWQAHIEDLAAHLVGRPAGDWRARWQGLVPAYREQAGGLG
jgi:hypothetical protein